MKKVRRLLSLLLALMMVAALVACTGDPKPGTDNPSGSTGNVSGSTVTNTKPTADDTFHPPAAPKEMEGKTFTFIQHDDVGNPFGYKGDSKNAELALARAAEVEELYGCTLEFLQIAYNDEFNNAIQQRAIAGDPGDLIFSPNNAQLRRTLGVGGNDSLMEDLLTVDHIINFWDMNKWGNITSRETMMAGGTFYGVTPALWYDYSPLPLYIITYNKEMIERFGATDPQEYWEREEWNRDTMLEVISACYDNSGSDPIWGMTATLDHMTRMTFLTTGLNRVIMDENDPSVWTRGIDQPAAAEALSWLKTALTAYKPNFNNGQVTWATWQSHTPFLEGKCAMALTRPRTLFDNIIAEAENLGLMVWGASENNFLSGYYENAPSVAIPTFAQNKEWSAFLMYSLFEGLGDVETQDDVVAYYRENYFDSDIDITVLMRDGADLQYSYWPNDSLDSLWSQLAGGLMNASSIPTLIQRYAASSDAAVEKNIVPNQVALRAYKAEGKY